MTTYTTLRPANPPTTLTLSHNGRTITITVPEVALIEDLFEMFHATLIGVGFVSATYTDMICQLADEATGRGA